jgi:hypothetical protein
MHQSELFLQKIKGEKIMKFTEAKNKVGELANGAFHSLNYSVTETSYGTLSQDCSVYVHDCNWHHGPTWEAAIDSLKRELFPMVKTEIEDCQLPLLNQ